MASTLLVGVSKATNELLKDCFVKRGYTCKTVSTAGAAQEMLESNVFDFILIDSATIGSAGLELAESIKKEQIGAAVIMMIEQDEHFPYDAAMTAGVDDFLKYPLSSVELLARIEIVERRQDLYRWAITDDLTNLYNEKGFFTLVGHQLKIAKRTKEEMFLLCVSLDNLKDINNKYGNKEHDVALIQTANIIRETFRESDILARVGEGEFVVFPVRTTRKNQGVMVERFGRMLAEYEEARKQPYNIVVSCGIASYDPSKPSSVDELLMEAHKMMFRIKEGEPD